MQDKTPGSGPLRRILWLLPAMALAGCKFEVLAPTGDVAAQQRDLLVQATVLMSLIIVPVLLLTGFFAWRYRASNTRATYSPEWAHSTKLELAIWAFPVLIVVALGTLTWVGTHLTDPYRPLDRIAKDTPLEADHTPFEVQVVALDWKWLFIYPEQGVASVNELAVPVDRPIRFRLTASSVMNAFYIPSMAGMIYAMPGMETTLNGVFNEEGEFRGLASHYSGWGFSGMKFTAHALAPDAFDDWVAAAREGEGRLDRAAYLDLEEPTENVPPMTYAAVEPELFDRAVNMCVEEGKMCMAEMMALDAGGGTGLNGTINMAALTRDEAAKRGARAPVLGWEPFQVAGYCTPEEESRMFGQRPAWAAAPPRDASPLRGAGLPRPGTAPGLTSPGFWSRPGLDLAALLPPAGDAAAAAPNL
ncbi:ubiquinol oxidase subunit II [Frigidibacter oleivorans]|uniref:ubiquinol oxidase subunit II n=1 Tax=Frigidibacter oleivorans TaxID=2487129 RepID=UPI00197AD5CE|nr:ubiquinol oxidase subunit II [Frigidibacter oleivorans]